MKMDIDDKYATPMNELMNKNLNLIESLSDELFTNISGQSIKPVKLPLSLLDKLSSVDEDLAENLELMKLHKSNQNIIEELSNDILNLESNIQSSLDVLNTSNKELEKIINEGDKVEGQIKLSKDSHVKEDVLLNYAAKLSNFTSAPPNINIEQLNTQQTSFNLPFPTEANMRRGALFAQSLEDNKDVTLHLDLGEMKDVNEGDGHYDSVRDQQQSIINNADDHEDVEFDLDLNDD